MRELGKAQDQITKLSEVKRSLLQKRLRGQSIQTIKTAHISRRANNDSLGLSFAQQRLWFLHQLEPDNHAYNITFSYRLRGRLDVSVFERSLNEIVKRHEALRTAFVFVNGKPIQEIASSVELPLSVIDLEGLSESEKEKEVHRVVSEESRRNFDLSKGPVLRTTLLRAGATEHFFILVVHHIAFDGWSAGVFLRELGELYTAFSNGQPSPLSELSIQYADFTHWQREWLQGQVLEDQLAYWKQQLGGGVSVLQLPTDRPRPAVQTYRGATESFKLSGHLKNELKKLSLRQGLTLFMTLLAGFQALLYRYTGQQDFALGSPIANRNRSEIENLIGFFVNTLVLKSDISGDPSFEELLARVREVTLGAYDHQDLPFERLVEELQPDRDLSYSPLFQVMFVLQNVSMKPGEFKNLTMTELEFETNASMFDLSLYIQEREEGLAGTFEYNTDLFDGATIARMALHFKNLLESVVSEPGQRLSELSLLTGAEHHSLLIEWNDTAAEYPEDRCIHELFEKMIEKTGTRAAVEFDEKSLTYNELNARGNQLANYLIKSGVKPKTYVGIYVERSLDLLVGLLGILKTGAAYVPMDPSFPPDRLAYMMEDAGISIQVTQEHLLDVFPQSDRKIVCIDKEWDTIQHENFGNPKIALESNTLAYTIYTSGSTGKPKGVMIEHRAVVNFLISMQKKPGFNEGDVLVAVTTISFDIAVLELFLPLIAGGKVVIAGKNEAIDGNLLLALIERSRATILQATPATWKLMIEAGWEKKPDLKMLCGGEPLPRDLANNMLKRGGELWNMYGPTETTIWSSIQKIEPGDDSILIGPPIANTQFYIVDRKMEPVPINVAGELLIGGDGLSRGYLNRSNLTAERFIVNPFTNDDSRVYRTGDLARFRSNGEVEFLGRLDFQVKVRGFRIELGEIENQLVRHGDVKEVVVVVHEDEKDDKRLVAYIIPDDEKELNVSDLRKFLREKLPEYMIPSLFVKMDEFPLTPNAKIDRLAFPAPDNDRPQLNATYVEPGTETEHAIANIWKEVLNVKEVGVHDNFFELGGHSMLAIKAVMQAGRKGLALKPRSIFLHPTIAELATLVDQKATAQVVQTESSASPTGSVPLTPAQIGFLHERETCNPHRWNFSILLQAHRLNPSVIEAALKGLLAYHDALRLRLSNYNGKWHQNIIEVTDIVPFEGHDLSRIGPEERSAYIEAVCEELQDSLNLSNGPVLRVAHFSCGPDQPDRLFFTMHHFVMDMFSWDIFREDFESAYEQGLAGGVIGFPRKTTSFREWAIRLRELAVSAEVRATIPRWLGLPWDQVGPLPLDLAATPGFNTNASACECGLLISDEESHPILKPEGDNRPEELMLAALAQALGEWTASPVVLIDCLNHGRMVVKDADLSRTVGFMLCYQPLVLEIEDGSDPKGSQRATIDQLRQLPEGFTFDLLRFFSEEEDTRRAFEKLPRAEVLFNFSGYQDDAEVGGPSALSNCHDTCGSAFDPRNGRYYPLAIIIDIIGNGLRLRFVYSRNLHQRSSIEQLAMSFRRNLMNIANFRSSEDLYTPEFSS